MSLEIVGALVLLAAIFGIALGYFIRFALTAGKKGSIELEIKQMLLDAREEAKKITEGAEKRAEHFATTKEAEFKEKEELQKKKEQHLLHREETLDRRQTDLDGDVEDLKRRIEEIRTIKESTKALHENEVRELERIAKLTPEEAKQELYTRVERENQEDMMVRVQKLEQTGKESLERKAQDILASAIQRLANSVTADQLSTIITIPNDEIKGKIIGKEGRNIKAFERATGVEVVIDESPGSIMISCFDPVRRHIARVALENLIVDGRIQPAKIEEMVQKAADEINRIIKEKGDQAAYEAGVLNLDPRVLAVLGRLHFRTSYGQNVLQHSIEMAHIAGMLAAEVGADVAIAKAGALVHDIGKALDHEVQGSHVEIGRRILQKFGTDERIIKAMQAHHEEYPYETVESIIVQCADAISGSRPGARRDSVENYLKRLSDLEAVANSFKGIEKTYAIAAGREIRVFVRPDEVTDFEARQLARDIALKIEQELKYPGEIKVIVIRENRVVEFAR